MSFNFMSSRSRKILVVSHERSGTHFLMNAIEKCFGYVASTFVNFDIDCLSFNFYDQQQIQGFFSSLRGKQLANIFKSHHPFEFFQGAMDVICEQFQVFYLYRDPRDVLLSYWRFLNQLPWHEGPKVPSPSELIRAAPCGRMLRYQWRQEPTMIHRWQSHVDSWTQGVPDHLRQQITFVRFRDLSNNYEGVMNDIGQTIGPPHQIVRPELTESSILPHRGIIGGYVEHFNSEDLAMFREIAGQSMSRLGFDPGK